MAKAWANTKSDTSSMCLTQRHSCHSLPLWSSPAGTSPPQPCMDSAEGKAHLHIWPNDEWASGGFYTFASLAQKKKLTHCFHLNLTPTSYCVSFHYLSWAQILLRANSQLASSALVWRSPCVACTVSRLCRHCWATLASRARTGPNGPNPWTSFLVTNPSPHVFSVSHFFFSCWFHVALPQVMGTRPQRPRVSDWKTTGTLSILDLYGFILNITKLNQIDRFRFPNHMKDLSLERWKSPSNEVKRWADYSVSFLVWNKRKGSFDTFSKSNPRPKQCLFQNFNELCHCLQSQQRKSTHSWYYSFFSQSVAKWVTGMQTTITFRSRRKITTGWPG